MMWMTWRQHRAQAWGGLVLIAVAAAIFLPYGESIRGAYLHNAIGGCLEQGTAGDRCQNAMSMFMQQFNGVANHLLTWFTPLPGLIGGIVGATVLGREYEHGTWRLVWTQAVPRTRWLVARILLLATGIAALTLSLSTLFGWFRSPMDQVTGRFSPGAFDLEGLTLTGYTLFAFAAGVLAGQLLRRTVPAIVAVFAAYMAVRLPDEFWLRPHYLTPLSRLASTVSPNIGPMAAPVAPGPPDWVVSRDLVDSGGHPLSLARQDEVYQALSNTSSLASRDGYLHAHGLQYRILYQPAGRFWTFQIIEAALFTGVAAALVGIAIWRLRRRSI
jgi:hypothetical protein